LYLGAAIAGIAALSKKQEILAAIKPILLIFIEIYINNKEI
jgi:hypothetical protein